MSNSGSYCMKALFTAYVVIVSLQHDVDLTLKIDVSNHDGDIQCVEGVADVSPKSEDCKYFSLVYSVILSRVYCVYDQTVASEQQYQRAKSIDEPRVTIL